VSKWTTYHLSDEYVVIERTIWNRHCHQSLCSLSLQNDRALKWTTDDLASWIQNPRSPQRTWSVSVCYVSFIAIEGH